MNKLYLLALMLLPSTALAADYDLLLLGTLLPNQTKQVELSLAKGFSQVEITTEDSSRITCTFTDPSSGLRIVEENRVICLGSADLNSPARLQVSIYNTAARSHDYKIKITHPGLK